MNGFIAGSRGSFMLDLVAVAMLAVIPALVVSIQFAKQRKYTVHRAMMLLIAGVLIATVVAFELEMRLIGWQHLAQQSPYFNTSLFYVLAVHLTISISTTILLIVTVSQALRKFERPARPGIHSRLHKNLGKATAIGLLFTSLTGWIFYWMAFVAT